MNKRTNRSFLNSSKDPIRFQLFEQRSKPINRPSHVKLVWISNQITKRFKPISDTLRSTYSIYQTVRELMSKMVRFVSVKHMYLLPRASYVELVCGDVPSTRVQVKTFKLKSANGNMYIQFRMHQAI